MGQRMRSRRCRLQPPERIGHSVGLLKGRRIAPPAGASDLLEINHSLHLAQGQGSSGAARSRRPAGNPPRHQLFEKEKKLNPAPGQLRVSVTGPGSLTSRARSTWGSVVGEGRCCDAQPVCAASSTPPGTPTVAVGLWGNPRPSSSVDPLAAGRRPSRAASGFALANGQPQGNGRASCRRRVGGVIGIEQQGRLAGLSTARGRWAVPSWDSHQQQHLRLRSTANAETPSGPRSARPAETDPWRHGGVGQ